jgi:hypothetical protein
LVLAHTPAGLICTRSIESLEGEEESQSDGGSPSELNGCPKDMQPLTTLTSARPPAFLYPSAPKAIVALLPCSESLVQISK